MTPSRSVWLSPREVRRDFGPVEQLADEAEGASGRMRYAAGGSWRTRAMLSLAALGSGIAIAAPLLAIGGVVGAVCAVAIGGLYTAALRLSRIVRARDRSIAHHGRFLPMLARIRVGRIRRRPAVAAMRLGQALAARQMRDDAGDQILATLLRVAVPVAAGLWVASATLPHAMMLAAAALALGAAAGAWLEARRDAAAFRAELAKSSFARRVAETVHALPVLRGLGGAGRAVARLRVSDPIVAQRRAAEASLRVDMLFRLAVPTLPLGVLLSSGGIEPVALLGAAVAATAAGQAGAGLGVQLARLSGARRRQTYADRLLGDGREPAAAAERIETIAVRDLSFRYPDAPAPVFEHVDFTLAAGEVLALSSPSGTGKTTLLRVLTALAEPRSGSVLVNGVRADELAYRHRVAAVFQDEPVGAGTIRSAIAGSTSIGLDTAWAMAERVGADALIRALPMGMQTLIVEGPFPPSLLQPLLIARALAQAPDLLILDEALGALPYERAAALLESLRGEGRLVIFASHDPAMVALADKVLDLGG